MKKSIVLATLALTLASASSYAQGYLTFANSSTTRVTVGNDTAASALGVAVGANVPLVQNLPAGVDLRVGLYYSLDNTSYAKLTDTGFSGSFSGRFGAGPTQIPGVAVGSSAWFQVRVWEDSYAGAADTFEAATAAGVQNGRSSVLGQSNPFQLTLGTSFTPAVMTAAGGLQPFTVTAVVPEPSTIALGLLGLAGLFIIRRRQ